ncbi:unnamed protein product [Lathyrus sativus]|nr:unnamed protein product [Lathyrus sativus]
MISSFIALIPKLESPQGMEDYRPISLIGCVYKVIFKILAARLSKDIGRLISVSQMTFVPGRQLLDEVLVANKLVNFAKRNKRCCLMLKVDFAKANNCVDWGFLEHIMLAMGFGLK